MKITTITTTTISINHNDINEYKNKDRNDANNKSDYNYNDNILEHFMTRRIMVDIIRI